jgi:HD-like signal output (HDOD) protein
MTASQAAESNANPATSRIPSAAAFEFVKQLASELSAGNVELPSFPDVAMRVQRVLADENVAPDRVVRVVGSEPALAARVLQMANSVALNPSGRPVVELRTAVARMGFDMLRSAAITFAMAQLRKAESFKSIEKPMNLLWQRSVVVATMSFVIAKRFTRLSPDAALLAGLLHNVGRLYILTRAARHTDLFDDQPTYTAIVRDWHANIAKALLENWGVAEELVEAIHDVEHGERDPRGPVSLSDVLAVAQLLASFREQPELLEAKLPESRSATRLGIQRDSLTRVLAEARSELQALTDALGA